MNDNKHKRSSKKRSRMDGINAEFKHLRKRVQQLEAIVFKSRIDNGLVGEPDDVIKKG